jgi:hypothetical protein
MGGNCISAYQPVPRAPDLTVCDGEWAALDRLIAYAAGASDSSRAIADMLMGWWNGRFDPSAVVNCDDVIVEDAIVVFDLFARCRW